MIPHVLRPFSPSPCCDRLSLGGGSAYQGPLLSLHYALTGDWSAIALPSRLALPQRRDNLWQTTCFEFFIGIKGDSRYWEFNLSPSGDWNSYRFSDYRQDMEPENRLTDLPFTSGQGSDRYSLELKLDLERLNLAGKSLEMSLTAVIEHRTEGISHWAIVHTGKEADFHRRDSFIVTLG